MALNDNLKAARIRMGHTQLWVAKNIGISNTALSNYETGYRQPDLETLKQLASYYDVSVDELIELDGQSFEPVYDLATASKHKKVAFHGDVYELTRGQRQELWHALEKMFSSFRPSEA